jgi:hypothetical protein
MSLSVVLAENRRGAQDIALSASQNEATGIDSRCSAKIGL